MGLSLNEAKRVSVVVHAAAAGTATLEEDRSISLSCSVWDLEKGVVVP